MLLKEEESPSTCIKKDKDHEIIAFHTVEICALLMCIVLICIYFSCVKGYDLTKVLFYVNKYMYK